MATAGAINNPPQNNSLLMKTDEEFVYERKNVYSFIH